MYIVSRTHTFARLFFIVSVVGLSIYIMIAFVTLRKAFLSMNQTETMQKSIKSLPHPVYHLTNQRKYILLWTVYSNENPIGEGLTPFINQDCLHQNCYLTTDKKLLEYIFYDAVIFDVTDMKRWNKHNFPHSRTPYQKYVFFGKRLAHDNPVCSAQTDNFFNWTWSYKLNSDIFSPFFEIRDLKGNIVAPKTEVEWNTRTTHQLDRIEPWIAKEKAVVCVIRRCGTAAKEALLAAKRLQAVFRRERMDFDIFNCRLKECPERNCLEVIKRNYYFYFVYEEKLATDYVSDTVLEAFEAGVVPIMAGSADFSKFLPPNSYINSGTMSPERLVALIFYAIKNPTVYQGFFRWKNTYTIHRTPLFKGLCQLCSMLHNPVLMNRQTSYERFRQWWYNGLLSERCMKILGEHRNSTAIKNVTAALH